MSPAPPPTDPPRTPTAQSQTAFWIRDDDHVLYVSPSYESLWSQSCDRLYADPNALLDAVHPDDRADVRTVLASALKNEDVARVECRVFRADGTTRWVELLSTPASPDPTTRRVSVVARDVTTQKREHRAMQKALTQAERVQRNADAVRVDAERDRRRTSRFLAHVSHELRTPLTSIIGFAEVLGTMDRDAIDAGDARRFARLIEQSGRRLLDTFNSVLTLSRLENAPPRPIPATIDLAAEIQQTLALFRESARAVGIRLRSVCPESSLPVVLDVVIVQRILSILVDNALKFTPSGGSVTVHATVTPDTAALVVADTGVGIEASFLPDLFDAFTQAPVVTSETPSNVADDASGDTPDPRGAGLGLAIAKRLVDVVGGTINVESTPGHGTTFTVCLPNTSAEPEST